MIDFIIGFMIGLPLGYLITVGIVIAVNHFTVGVEEW